MQKPWSVLLAEWQRALHTHTMADQAQIERLHDELQIAREALQRASGWLHAAYDMPPRTPECESMLKEVDAAAQRAHGIGA